jgi:hypothetical protein
MQLATSTGSHGMVVVTSDTASSRVGAGSAKQGGGGAVSEAFRAMHGSNSIAACPGRGCTAATAAMAAPLLAGLRACSRIGWGPPRSLVERRARSWWDVRQRHRRGGSTWCRMVSSTMSQQLYRRNMVKPLARSCLRWLLYYCFRNHTKCYVELCKFSMPGDTWAYGFATPRSHRCEPADAAHDHICLI